MTENALRVLGLVRRAGKLRWGYDTAVEALKTGEARLVILAGDLSEKTKKNVRFEAARHSVPVLSTAYTMEDLFNAMGKKTGVLAVCDAGFAEKLRRDMENLGGFQQPIEEREECCL